MTDILTTLSKSTITAPAAIRGRLVGNRAAITARTIARRRDRIAGNSAAARSRAWPRPARINGVSPTLCR